MRHSLRFGWAAAIGLAVAGSATAQIGTNTGSGAGGGLPTQLPTGLPGASGSGGAGGTGTGAGGGSLSAAPTITGMNTTTANQGVLNQSNILGSYYANPYYQGRAGADPTTAPGGFGQALYGGNSTGSGGFPTGTGTSFGRTTGTSTGIGGTGTTGFGSTTGFGGTSGFGGTTGRTGFGGSTGFGGTSGRTGFGGGNAMTNFGGTGGNSASSGLPGGQIVQLPSPISYSAVVRLPAPTPLPNRMTNQIKAMLDRSTVLSNPQGIQVSSNGPVVTLRGTVSSPDEARLIEGMVRLTPGVRDVLNELQYPAPPQP
jgi:hypothetical protein